jgi:hypothetical protein
VARRCGRPCPCHEDLPRLGGVAEALGDEHRGAVEVLAGIEPDAERIDSLLHLDGAPHSGHGAGEDDHQPAPGGTDLLLAGDLAQRRDVLAVGMGVEDRDELHPRHIIIREKEPARTSSSTGVMTAPAAPTMMRPCPADSTT